MEDISGLSHSQIFETLSPESVNPLQGRGQFLLRLVFRQSRNEFMMIGRLLLGRTVLNPGDQSLFLSRREVHVTQVGRIWTATRNSREVIDIVVTK